MGLSSFGSVFISATLLSISGVLLEFGTVNCFKLEEAPENTTVRIGQTIVLRCLFDEPVDECQWYRSDFILTIDGRYNYVSNDGIRTHDCSLKITNVSSIDFKQFQCQGRMFGSNTVVSSKPFSIYQNKFVGIATTLIDTVELNMGETMLVNCFVDDLNEVGAVFQWEYKRDVTDHWSRYFDGQEVNLSNEKLGYFRCSSTLKGHRHYSMDYFVKMSENGSKNTVVAGVTNREKNFLIAGLIIGTFLIVALVIAIAVSVKLNYSIKYSKKRKNSSESVPLIPTDNIDPQETEPLLNISEVVPRNTQKIDEASPGGTCFDWEIDDYETKMLNETTKKTPYLLSNIFNVKGTAYYFRVKLYLNGFDDEMGSFMSILLEVVNPDINPNNHFHHKRKILLLDQSGYGRHMSWEHEPNFKSDEVQSWMKGFWGPCMFFPISLLKYNEKSFLNEGTLKIRVIIEPMLTLTKHLTLEDNSQGFIWKIDNYLQRLQDEYDDFCRCIESEPFYCYPGGYRAKCVVYLNGCGKGKHEHISIFYGFLNGQHDKALPPAFSHRAILRILDQNKSNKGNHIEKKYTLRCDGSDEDVEKMSEFHGFHTFAERKKINRKPFVVEDSLIIQVLIKPLTNKELLKSQSSYSLESEKMGNTTTMRTDTV